MTTDSRSTRRPPFAGLLTRRRAWPAAALIVAALLVAVVAALAGCNPESGAADLSRRAKNQWQKGEYEDAARSFVALTEIYPTSALAEESLYFAASLYDEFLHDNPSAIRYYQQLIVQYPESQYALDAKESLADLYASSPDTLYRALQIYKQLVITPALRDRREEFQYRIAETDVQMGRTDQARYELRAFMQQFPKSSRIPQVYYLIGYTYYLENRKLLALAVMDKTVKAFPDTPEARQAQFFMADTQEEMGHLQEALRLFQGLQGKYHDPEIIDKRIETLQARLKRGVR